MRLCGVSGIHFLRRGEQIILLFFIRKGWLSKGMKYVDAREDVFISKDENPMDVLGIGANMVKSLRYWLLA